jgi:hypothetical protein
MPSSLSAVARTGGVLASCAALLFALSQSGCGYELVGRRGTVPGDIASLHIGKFENHSREVDLDEKIVLALEREFYRRGVVRVEEEAAAGDAEIRGAVRTFRTDPVTFDVGDEALQYEMEITVDAILERRSDGEVLWRGNGIYAVDTYSVRTDTVVPSSSQFQRGVLDFDTLDDLTPIQLAETERRLCIDRMVKSIVRDLHERLLDDF